ncbi:MAG TPA: NAD-dependent succinate-semialdehyde dehydrogenase [Tepidisphaeraceae bacterium]|nr:NAD-dependent succinate-semialdehyde dehydrogenase [Tepidisphaeraceae bacterium]
MIRSPLLINTAGFVAGRWAHARSGDVLRVTNPATGEPLADVPNMATAETAAAVEAAAEALRTPVAAEKRRHWLAETARLLRENQQELARIITSEQGKPLKESVVEVEYSAGFFDFFAAQLHHLAPAPLPGRIRQMNWTVYRRPAGVVGLITPWNFPLAMLAKKLAPAMAAGCAVVTKPADLTPLTAIALWSLLEQLDVPAGWLNLVIGRPAPIGDVLCAHPAVRLISFTGSTAVGKRLIQATAPHVKRLALELGGNAPYVVLNDADVTAAADALMANKFRCAGQTCVCANRIYIQRAAEQSFVEAISARVGRLNVGNGMEPQVDIGPLINRAAFEKVDRHVRDALERGARRMAGGVSSMPDREWGAFYTPTILVGAHAGMLLSREETFGPVVAIETFDTDEEAVAKANGTPFGLAAYLFTRDVERAEGLARQLRFGHVGLNTGTGPTPEAPFGGMKQSGFGREGGVEGLHEFCEVQTVVAP